jgi:very-short-patch-repair endonuclease
VPAPKVQVRVLDDRGRFIARVDMLGEEEGVVGEADGLVKYAGASPARAVAEEKQREARLQALGLVVVRWTAEQLDGDPPLVVEQLRAALANSDGRRFRGRFVF